MAALSPAPVEDITNSVIQQPSWVAAENTQLYDQSQYAYISSHPKRHILGLVGGNEVAFSKANMIDVESDLQGITRANSDCTGRHHLPNTPQVIVRNTPKEFVRVDTATVPLKPTQMWAYPAVIAPEPLIKETCGAPHKY